MLPVRWFRVILQRAANFRRALHWPFRAGVKNQRHAVAGRNFYSADRPLRPSVIVPKAADELPSARPPTARCSFIERLE